MRIMTHKIKGLKTISWVAIIQSILDRHCLEGMLSFKN